MITGVRGSGKTVYMTNICKRLKQYNNWIVLEVSPEDDILRQIVYKLSKESGLNKLIVSAQIDLSILRVEVTKAIHENTEQYALLLEKLLGLAAKAKRR